MREDVAALRAHLVAEVERAQRDAAYCQRRASRVDMTSKFGPYVLRGAQKTAWIHYETARTATDAWLAADARLRALDGLLAASKAQHDAYELQSTGTFARGRWYTREEIDALMLAPCEGDACARRECLPCGLRRLGPR